MIVGRPEEFAGDTALIDHLKIAFGWIDLDFSTVKEAIKVV